MDPGSVPNWSDGRRLRRSMTARQGFGRTEAAARRLGRLLWDHAEAHLDHPLGRGVLRAASAAALALQYRDRCVVRWHEGVWEYRWPDAVVLSDRPLIVRARPAECGRPAGLTLIDDFLWDYVPVAGDVVFDVGAGIGSELHVLTELVGSEGRIYAFEPHPKTFRVLQRLCEANGWTNVEPVRAAITDASGTVSISDDFDYETNDIFRRTGGYEVACYSLDDFIAAHGIARIDFLKMNIEGAEALAIRGMNATAAITRHVTICCHDFLATPEKQTKSEVRTWLARERFQVRERTDNPFVHIRDYLYGSR